MGQKEGNSLPWNFPRGMNWIFSSHSWWPICPITNSKSNVRSQNNSFFFFRVWRFQSNFPPLTPFIQLIQLAWFPQSWTLIWGLCNLAAPLIFCWHITKPPLSVSRDSHLLFNFLFQPRSQLYITTPFLQHRAFFMISTGHCVLRHHPPFKWHTSVKL